MRSARSLYVQRPERRQFCCMSGAAGRVRDNRRNQLGHLLGRSGAVLPETLRAALETSSLHFNLEWNEAILDSLNHSSNAICSTKLSHRIGEMELDRFLGDRKDLSDFPVCLSLLAPSHTFQLLRGEISHAPVPLGGRTPDDADPINSTARQSLEVSCHFDNHDLWAIWSVAIASSEPISIQCGSLHSPSIILLEFDDV